MQTPRDNKIILEERLNAIEVEVSKIRRRIKMLPSNHKVSWPETRKAVEEIVSDVFDQIG